MRLLSIFISAVFFIPSRAHAMAGNLKKLQINTSVEISKVEHPHITLALGYLEKSFANHLITFFETSYIQNLQRMIPGATVEILRQATSQDILITLKDPETIGLVLVGHTYKIHSNTVAFLMSSSQPGYLEPLPRDILSTATPSLRFLAFFGCYGPSLLEHYQVESRLKDLPGSHTFFYNQDQSLRGARSVTSLLKTLAEHLNDSNL